MTDQFNVSVIIATTAEKKRKEQLNNAINGVLNQKGCDFKLLIIINGNRFDPELRSELEANSNIYCHYQEEGSYPKALLFGRSKIATSHFCFLDDDDELLPNSLANRLAAFRNFPNVDVVVGNGEWKKTKINKYGTHHAILEFAKDPLLSLLQPNGNWLCSCAGMFKAEMITQSYFEDYAPYGEWTYLAYKLAIHNKIHFIEHKCFRINLSAESLSHSNEYLLGLYAMQNKVLGLPLPDFARRLFSLKMKDMEHTLAVKYLKEDEFRKAWFYHLKSLNNVKSFFRFALFTRHLLFKNV